MIKSETGTKYVALDGIWEYRRKRRHSSIEHNAPGENGLWEYLVDVEVHLKMVCPSKIKATLKVPDHSMAGKKTSCARHLF